MAAIPRAATAGQRTEFLHILGHATPRWYIGIDKFLGRLARDDADRNVRIRASDLRRYLMGNDADPDDDADLDEEW